MTTPVAVPDARRYLLNMVAMVVLLLISVPAMNIAVDPLGYARLVGWRPANPNDAELSFAAGGAWPVPDGTRAAKMLNVAYYQPQSVIFGSSTVWSFIDAGYAPLRDADGRPAFNFGLAGVSLREMEAAFAHVVALKPPMRAVLGLEFYMFSADKATSPGFFDLPMAQRGDYRREQMKFVSRRLFAADYAYETQAILWEPLTRRVESVVGRHAWLRRPAPNYGIGVGAGPRPVEPPMAAATTTPRQTREDFLKMMLDGDRILLAGLYPAPGQPFRFEDDAHWSSFDALRRMVAVARAHRIDLRLYLSPHHARSYEAIRLMGWWPQYEAWQRGVAGILDDDARAHPGEARVPLWDFGGYTSVTSDPVMDVPPAPAGYRWYSDAIHFRAPVGYMLLDRIFPSAGVPPLPADFGVLVTSGTVDHHLAQVALSQQRYAAANAAEVAGISGMLESLGRRHAAEP